MIKKLAPVATPEFKSIKESEASKSIVSIDCGSNLVHQFGDWNDGQ